MSDSKLMNTNFLYGILLREAENDDVLEVAPELYESISHLIGKLKSEGYDGVEGKVMNKLISMVSEITSLLLKIRLEKAIKTNKINYNNLTDEEKFILEAQDEVEERKKIILSGTLNGKSKLLESIAQNHKTKLIAVRFLKEMDQIIGSDLGKYGPFNEEDIATIPYENAQALITKNIATKIRWED